MILVPNVSRSQARKCVELYEVHGYTQKVVGLEMGWSSSKVARVWRLYERYGEDCFARDRTEAKAICAGDTKKTRRPVAGRIRKGSEASAEDDPVALDAVVGGEA